MTCLRLALLAVLLAACSSSSTVAPPPPPPGAVAAAITVTPLSASLSVGGTTTLSALAYSALGQVVTPALSWSSSALNVATVDAKGKVMAVAVGTSNLTASSGSVTSNVVSITVTLVAGVPGQVVIDKASMLLTGSDQSAQLTAQSLDLLGTPVGAALTWTSSAPDKVSVDATGRLTAKAIGSARIVAEAGGIRSAPTLVLVAQPQPGALIVTDAQVVSVGPPLRLASGELPGVGSEFEVTLRDVSAPAPGSLVIAAETAPVAGRVVGSRQEAAGLVITLAIEPLYRLFSAYDIALTLDLSAFPFEAVPERSSLRSSATTLSALWKAGRNGRPPGLAAVPALDVLSPFRAFDCDGSIKPKLLGAPIQLSLENQLNLVLVDRPGYSKHALEGTAALVGSAGLKLDAGFKASGRCDAQIQLRFPIFGWFSLLVMPAVRFGLGAELIGEVKLVKAELGVEGRIEFKPVVGWECGGITPACRGLGDISREDKFKTKSKFPSENDPKATISAQFYVLAGLDAAFLGGVANAKLLEARVGPKQSFNLAWEDDQAAQTDYAASYDLKLEGVVEPGPALKKAIEKVINDAGTEVSFSAKFSFPISESPKGSLSVNKALVRPGQAVDFTVELTQQTVNYWIIGYNVTAVALYRKREDESRFTFFRWMETLASAGKTFTYKWVPVEADAGKYQFAAFVDTKSTIPTPSLEIAPNSIQPVEVSCFPGGAALRTGPQAAAATACFDTWAGTATLINRTPGLPTANITSRSSITWTLDPTISGNGYTYYTASGSFDLAINSPPETGCTIALSPRTFAIVQDSLTPSRLGIIDNGFTPATYGFGGSQLVNFTSTASCPGRADVVTQFTRFLAQFAFGSGPFTAGQLSLIGTSDDGVTGSTWDFRRP